MACTHPKSAGYKADGKSITFSPKSYAKKFGSFQVPCGKCVTCRIDKARDWAIRATHEASCHESNSFLTLTYNDQHLGDNRLNYRDFQLFAKKLRKSTSNKIGIMAVGEYGDLSKRKHWHAILFNYKPSDLVLLPSNGRGDSLYRSDSLAALWGKGNVSVGDVTYDSAAYVAGYTHKKLVHGRDGSHEFNPIFRASSKRAIGKSWLEKNFLDIFNRGQLFVELDGKITQVPIPRYYKKWLEKEHPALFEKYKRTILPKIQKEAQAKNEREIKKWLAQWEKDECRSLKPLERYAAVATLKHKKYLKEKRISDVS